MPKISKTAVVHPGALIEPGVEIGDFCVIGEHVVLGSGTRVFSHVSISGRTKIGKNNKIFPFASLGYEPQDLKFAGEDVELVIGDDNLIREHCMFNPGTAGGISRTIIGNGNLFMAYAHVAHDCVIGNSCIFANAATLGGHVEIADYVNFGGLSAAHQFVKVGEGAMISAGSILFQDAPPYCMLDGPRAIIRGLNRHRLRKLFSREEIDKIASLYRKIFDKNDLMTENAKKIRENLACLGSTDKSAAPDPENFAKIAAKICDFVINSSRGIPINKGQI